MVKVVISSVPYAAKPDAKRRLANKKLVTNETGAKVYLRRRDAESLTFSDDLTYAFVRNVAKAREENKRLLGVRDRAPTKD